MGLLNIRVKTEKDLFEIGKAFPANDWFFRGHSNRKWKLTPSIERYHKAYSPKDNKGNQIPLSAIEKNILRNYSVTDHFKSQPSRLNYDYIEKMIDLQHHGCATRLLDITSGFNDACFFTFSDSLLSSYECGCCIWCFKVDILKRHIREHGNNTIYKDLSKWDINKKAVDCFFDNMHEQKGVIVVGNLVECQQARQNGLFLMNVSYKTKFIDEIYTLYKIDDAEVTSEDKVEDYSSLKLEEYLLNDIIQIILVGTDFLKSCEKNISIDKARNERNLFVKGLVPEIVALNRFVKGFEI